MHASPLLAAFPLFLFDAGKENPSFLPVCGNCLLLFYEKVLDSGFHSPLFVKNRLV
jgi:hypothetical protein